MQVSCQQSPVLRPSLKSVCALLAMLVLFCCKTHNTGKWFWNSSVQYYKSYSNLNNTTSFILSCSFTQFIVLFRDRAVGGIFIIGRRSRIKEAADWNRRHHLHKDSTTRTTRTTRTATTTTTTITTTRTNHFVEVADVDAKSPALGLLPRLHLHQVVSQMHLSKNCQGAELKFMRNLFQLRQNSRKKLGSH